MTPTQVRTGMIFGKLTIRTVFTPASQGPVNMRRKCRVECTCGLLITIPIYYLTRKHNPKTKCGQCDPKSIITLHQEEYRIWMMMHERTENPRHVSYHHYGGRGIRVCVEWQKSRDDGQGFANFLSFVGPRPSPQHSIDRVDNDQGYVPYHPNTGAIQVRWATSVEQRANQRPYTNSKAAPYTQPQETQHVRLQSDAPQVSPSESGR